MADYLTLSVQVSNMLKITTLLQGKNCLLGRFLHKNRFKIFSLLHVHAPRGAPCCSHREGDNTNLWWLLRVQSWDGTALEEPPLFWDTCQGPARVWLSANGLRSWRKQHWPRPSPTSSKSPVPSIKGSSEAAPDTAQREFPWGPLASTLHTIP